MEFSENWTLPTVVGIIIGALIGKNWSKIQEAVASLGKKK